MDFAVSAVEAKRSDAIGHARIMRRFADYPPWRCNCAAKGDC
jgi:hypothetical protein